MTVSLDIPEDVLASLPVSEADRPQYLAAEIACDLYARDLISLGRAAELAGLSKYAFGQEVGRRGIPRHYSGADLEADLTYAGCQ